MAVFAVTTAKGPNWQSALGIREQPAWDEHAAFADGLVADDVVIIGGPVGSEQDEDIALMAVESADEPALRSVFDADPWVAGGIIRIRGARPWTLWLDSRRGGS